MTHKAIHAFGTMLKMSDGAGPVGDAEWTITVNATGGTYTITLLGQTTTGLAFGANAATIETALEALSSVGSGNVNVTDDSGTVHRVTLAGTLVSTAATLTTNPASLTGGAHTATVAIVNVGSPGPVYTTVAELKSIPVPQLESPRIDVSTHDNAQFTREYVNNLSDLPAVQFDINYLPNDPTHDHNTGLLARQLAGDVIDYKVFYNSRVVPAVVLTFPASIASFRPSAPVDNVYTAQVSMQPAAAPTYAQS